MKKYTKSIFIFRRDLRLQDNTGLIYALENSDQVIPCFIFNPLQINENEYRSDTCLSFMIESLKELNEQLNKKTSRLYLFYGSPEDVVRDLIQREKLDAVILNKDYTPFSQHRDFRLEEICKKCQIDFNSFDDVLLHAPDQVFKGDGGVYTVFTPFYRKASEIDVCSAKKNLHKNYVQKVSTKKYLLDDDCDLEKKFSVRNLNKRKIFGGRKLALKILKQIKMYKTYDDERDFPILEKTTSLSAHHKFGTVSIREVYYAIADALGKDHTLIRQLYWRDFLTQIGFHYPQVLGNAFQEKYNTIKWSHDKDHFRAWCDGKTGFPIVDAGMRELNQTGFMHNRVRMIAASFLVKDLHIDWRWGEKYFAQKLVDYDPLVNNGNWQWAASTGCDAQPYFRIFNPWRQQERFDADCMYIKRWVPELKDLTPKEIHQLYMKKNLFAVDYPEPIVDHKKMADHAKEMFRR